MRVVRKYHEGRIRAMTQDQADAWIVNGAHPVIVVAAYYFENSREKPEDVEEFLVAMQMLSEHTTDADRRKLTGSFITQCRTVLGIFRRYNFDEYKIGRFCDGDIFDTLGNFLGLIKTHYQPVPFHPDSTM